MKHKKLTITAAFLLAALTAQVQAGFYDWLGGISDDWSDSSNWQNGATLGAEDTARIYNSDISSDPTPNNTVLKTGDDVTLTRVWLGNSGDSNESGVLTVESGASLTTSGDFNLENNSTLTSSGAILVNTVNGMILRDNANLTLMDGGTLNKLLLEQNSTATLEAGSSVTTIGNINNSAQLTLNTSYTGNMFNGSASSLIINGTVNGDVFAASDSSITVNGTLNGTFGNASTSMQYISENGTVNGTVEIDNNDQMTVAGSVNGRFFIKSSAQVIIEPTANVLSNHNNSWIYDTPTVTWKVGADGSIGTLRTNRGSGDYTAEWRYANSDVVVVVDLTDCEVYGSSITLQLVSGIQNEENFANKVTFLYDGEAVTGFTWDGAGSGSFTGVLSNPEPDADGDGVADSVDAFPNDPNESADSDGDTVGDNADAFPNDPNETVDTDGDSVGDNSDIHNGLDDTAINNALGITTADGKINLSAWLATNSYIVDDGSSGGTSGYTEQQLIDLRVGSQLASIDNDQATLQVVIEQSADLISWSPLKTENVTVDAPAGTPKLFFRYRMQD